MALERRLQGLQLLFHETFPNSAVFKAKIVLQDDRRD